MTLRICLPECVLQSTGLQCISSWYSYHVWGIFYRENRGFRDQSHSVGPVRPLISPRVVALALNSCIAAELRTFVSLGERRTENEKRSALTSGCVGPTASREMKPVFARQDLTSMASLVCHF